MLPLQLQSQLLQARLQVSNYSIEDDGDNGDDSSDGLYLHCGYCRLKVVDDKANNDALSDYIKIRLLIARAKALAKHRELNALA